MILCKVRPGVTSKGKGKSEVPGLSYIKLINEVVYLVAIFDKGEKDNIAREQILTLLKKADLE